MYYAEASISKDVTAPVYSITWGENRTREHIARSNLLVLTFAFVGIENRGSTPRGVVVKRQALVTVGSSCEVLAPITLNKT